MADAQNPSIFRSPGIGIVAGSVVGVAIVVVMTLTGFGIHEETATEIPTPQASIDFTEAYGDMLQSDYLQSRESRRVLASGQTSTAASVIAQLDGDSVTIAGGNITIIRGNARSVCPLPVAGATEVVCPSPMPVFDAEEAIDAQIQRVERLVSEEEGSYSVVTSDNECFRLSLTTRGLQADQTDLQWGNRAEFCFDDETNALKSARIEKDGGVDTVTSTFLTDDIDEGVLDRLARGDQSDLS